MRKLLLLVGMLSWMVQAQDVRESGVPFKSEAARNYPRPLVTGFCSNLNAGWFHRTPRPIVAGLDVEFDYEWLLGTSFEREDQAFTTKVPLAIPQFTVGTLYGTHVTLRLLPKSISKQIGSPLTYSGFGIQHNPEVWARRHIPINLAFALYSQTMRQGNFFVSKATAIGITFDKRLGKRLAVGKRIFKLMVYGGILSESSKREFKYSQTVSGQERIVSFVEKRQQSVRATLGLSLRVFGFTVNADYSLAQYNIVTGGMHVAI